MLATAPTVEALQERVHELTEENAYLRRLLTLETAESEVSRLQTGLGLTPVQTQVVSAIYNGKGRIVTTAAIVALLGFDRDHIDGAETLRVHVHRIRKALGDGFLINTWGKGYQLSPRATEICDRILSTAQEQAAA